VISKPVAVVGGGAWGTALAIHLARLEIETRLWIFEEDLARYVLEHRTNPAYLPGVVLPERVRPSNRLDEVLDGIGLAIVAVPSPFARAVYVRMRPLLGADVPLVVATKGIEEDTLALPLEVASDALGGDPPLAVLSGPTFAQELADGHATAVVVASPREGLAEQVQDALSSERLRMYTNRDPIGVQIGGSLKNVIALAAGMIDGLGMGHNARAALVTRGLAELSRLGLAMGGAASTFSGLAGLGDLVLTCTGDLSRNRTVGRRIGRGERLRDVLEGTRSVAEGVRTTRSARALGRREGVEMPIVEEVHRILYDDGSVRESLERLMSRPLVAEDRP